MSNILASHINLYTSPVFYHFILETPQRPFHNLHSEFSFSLNIIKHVCSLWNLLPNSISHEAAPHQLAPRKLLSRRANQRASSGHVIICCHPTCPRATMTTRLLMTFIQVKQYMMYIYNPLRHNDINPIFATHAWSATSHYNTRGISSPCRFYVLSCTKNLKQPMSGRGFCCSVVFYKYRVM